MSSLSPPYCTPFSPVGLNVVAVLNFVAYTGLLDFVVCRFLKIVCVLEVVVVDGLVSCLVAVSWPFVVSEYLFVVVLTIDIGIVVV